MKKSDLINRLTTRKARNPATNAVIEVPAKRVIKPRVPASLTSMAG